MNYRGSCHCGAVSFEVQAPERLQVSECNCSICTRSGYLHLIVPRERFQLLRGEDSLSTYTFDSGEAQHYFCTTCGIKSFYVPRSHPDGISVNVRCLEDWEDIPMDIEPFDGRNWEASAHLLRPLDRNT